MSINSFSFHLLMGRTNKVFERGCTAVADHAEYKRQDLGKKGLVGIGKHLFKKQIEITIGAALL